MSRKQEKVFLTQVPKLIRGKYQIPLLIKYNHSYWWLVQVPYWFKVGFLRTILGFFRAQGEKDNFSGGNFQACQVPLNWATENLNKSENFENIQLRATKPKNNVKAFYKLYIVLKIPKMATKMSNNMVAYQRWPLKLHSTWTGTGGFLSFLSCLMFGSIWPWVGLF